MPSRFTVVRILLGILLLAAAGLKLYGPLNSGTFRNSLLVLSQWDLLAVGVELSVGVWLLSGWWPRTGWLVALLLFVILSGVSLTKALGGAVSCGCFGRLEVSPWAAVGLDLAAVIALLVFAPNRDDLTDTKGITPLQWVFRGVAVTGVALGGLFVYATHDLGAVCHGSFVVEPGSYVDVGRFPEGSVITVRLTLKNRSSSDVTLVGAQASCSLCLVVSDLPLTIPAGGQKGLSVQINFRGQPRSFEEAVVLFSDDPRCPQLRQVFNGEVQADLNSPG